MDTLPNRASFYLSFRANIAVTRHGHLTIDVSLTGERSFLGRVPSQVVPHRSFLPTNSSLTTPRFSRHPTTFATFKFNCCLLQHHILTAKCVQYFSTCLADRFLHSHLRYLAGRTRLKPTSNLRQFEHHILSHRKKYIISAYFTSISTPTSTLLDNFPSTKMSFHYFTLLPVELQILVWEWAHVVAAESDRRVIRSTREGVFIHQYCPRPLPSHYAYFKRSVVKITPSSRKLMQVCRVSRMLELQARILVGDVARYYGNGLWRMPPDVPEHPLGAVGARWNILERMEEETRKLET